VSRVSSVLMGMPLVWLERIPPKIHSLETDSPNYIDGVGGGALWK
jgi:hypothetical protein